TTLRTDKPDWEAWLLFFLRSLIKQKDALIRKIDLTPSSATGDLHPLAREILALLPDHETLTLRELVRLTGGKSSTLKLRIKELIECGHLIPKGKGRGAYYLRADVADRR